MTEEQIKQNIYQDIYCIVSTGLQLMEKNYRYDTWESSINASLDCINNQMKLLRQIKGDLPQSERMNFRFNNMKEEKLYDVILNIIDDLMISVLHNDKIKEQGSFMTLQYAFKRYNELEELK